MPNKHQALAEPFKLMDKAIEDFNKSTDSMFSEITYVSRLEQEVKQLKDIVKGYRFEIATLKKSLSKAGELIEELKKENKFLQLPLNERIEQEWIAKRESEEINNEINEEKGKEI